MRGEVGLVDAGDGRRLERFGARLVDRPAPGADGPRRDPAPWFRADLRFDPGRGWTARGGADATEAWTVEIDGVTLELRPTSSGGLGLYPEHAANLGWLAARVARRRASGGEEDPAPAVLNLFAHTGLATLALARAGAAVAHVDAARSAVAWARRNAELSGLADRPVRWLVDDALAFVQREARRGRQYAGFVLDPPSFGRAGGRGGGRPSGAEPGGRGRRDRGRRGGRAAHGEWTLREDLPELLEACAAIAEEDAFVLLTAHSTGLDPADLADELASAFRSSEPSIDELTLEAESGARLDLGWAVRLDPLEPAP
ncbi:MAG TPA: hypothetical protein VGJ17_09900 [Candidatus Limnocylindrales bacterium]